jgi:hypothetical protein
MRCLRRGTRRTSVRAHLADAQHQRADEDRSARRTRSAGVRPGHGVARLDVRPRTAPAAIAATGRWCRRPRGLTVGIRTDSRVQRPARPAVLHGDHIPDIALDASTRRPGERADRSGSGSALSIRLWISLLDGTNINAERGSSQVHSESTHGNVGRHSSGLSTPGGPDRRQDPRDRRLSRLIR